MRKHHNRLFFGQYTHKASFKIKNASMLYPTTDQHLLKLIRLYEHTDMPDVVKLCRFILENRHKIKFRLGYPASIFYGDQDTILSAINTFWNEWTNTDTTDPKKVPVLDTNTVACRRLPLGRYQYQVYVKRKMSNRLTVAQRELLYKYLTQNEENATITNQNIKRWLSGEGAIHYDMSGYFYVRDEKALTPIYMISSDIVDKVIKFVKV
jgi:hypothetical protein